MIGATLAVGGLAVAGALIASGFGAGIGVGMILAGGALYMQGRQARKEQAAGWGPGPGPVPMSYEAHLDMARPWPEPMAPQQPVVPQPVEGYYVYAHQEKERALAAGLRSNGEGGPSWTAVPPISPEATRYLNSANSPRPGPANEQRGSRQGRPPGAPSATNPPPSRRPGRR